jgi:hypothetical protein
MLRKNPLLNLACTHHTGGDGRLPDAFDRSRSFVNRGITSLYRNLLDNYELIFSSVMAPHLSRTFFAGGALPSMPYGCGHGL